MSERQVLGDSPGHQAVVEMMESLRVTQRYSLISFPPLSLSLLSTEGIVVAIWIWRYLEEVDAFWIVGIFTLVHSQHSGKMIKLSVLNLIEQIELARKLVRLLSSPARLLETLLASASKNI